MGSIYKGWGINRTQVGECENGNVYSGWGMNRTQIGQCENGNIYNGWGMNRIQIGQYENGNIYSGWGMNRTQIGQYENGNVYSGWGINRTQVGEYTESPDEAAALLLFADELMANPLSVSYESTGVLETLLHFLSIIGALLLKILSPFLIYLILPGIVGLTWIGFPAYIFLMLYGGIIGIIISYLLAIPSLFFTPYWYKLIYHRLKKEITALDIAGFYWKWFITGPFYVIKLLSLAVRLIQKKTTWDDISDFWVRWFWEKGLNRPYIKRSNSTK